MSKEEKEIDLIKDYLQIKGFDSTLVCLEKEEKFKNVERKQKKVNNIFQIYFFPLFY